MINTFKDVRWNPTVSKLSDGLYDFLKGRQIDSDTRDKIVWYVDLCVRAGFCKTGDDMRQCAERYLAGKRKVSPPGTKRRKEQAKQRRKLLSNVPESLLTCIKAVVSENAKIVEQVKQGNDKALNALVGKVMKVQRYDAVAIRELLSTHIY